MPWALSGYLCFICLSFGALRYSRIKATRYPLKIEQDLSNID